MGIKLPRAISKDTERQSMGFEIPNGEYLVNVNACEMKTKKNSNDQYISVILEISDSAREVGEKSIGFKIFETLALTDAAAFRLEGFLDACYPPKFGGDSIPDDIISKQLVVKTKNEEYEGFEKTRCTSFKAATNWKGVTTKIDGEGKITEKDRPAAKTEAKAKSAGDKEEVVM